MKPTIDHPDSHVTRLSDKRRPVVRLVVFVTALACALLAAFTGWFVWHSQQTQIRQTEVANANVARMVGAQVEAAMKATSLALANVVERVEHDGTAQASLARLQRHLVELTRTTPELHGIFVYGADGSWLATSLPETTLGNNADRSYFRYHLEHPGRAIHIAPPVKSRSTGVWVLPVSRRIDHPDGSFAGVALITLKVNFFERIYDELDVGRTGTVLLALADGTVVYRRPFDERVIGTNLAQGVVFQAIRKRPIGSEFMVARVDNIERLYSYRRVDRFAFVIAVGQTRDELLAGWKRSSLVIAAVALLVGLVFVLFAARLLKQFAIRDRLDQKLRAYSQVLERDNLGLQQLAHTDTLTGLANRRRFDEVLAHELRRAALDGSALALVLLDVDYFKKYNDRHGHPAGDACLQAVARILADQVNRNRDLAARYGGEEFALVLPDTDAAGALAVAERIRAAIEAMGAAHADSPFGVVTASAGLAVFGPGDGNGGAAGDAAAGLLARADAQLYRAKDAGRNRVAQERGTN